MKVIIHDLDPKYRELVKSHCDCAVAADGKYAPCRGCFGCWTRHPAECGMKDRLQQICRIIGRSDNLVIITKNLYGGCSAAVKNVLDRSIGTSTPLSTYRGKQMHHTLRYGRHHRFSVWVYGDISEDERSTWQLMAERNAINEGFQLYDVTFAEGTDALEKIEE